MRKGGRERRRETGEREMDRKGDRMRRSNTDTQKGREDDGKRERERWRKREKECKREYGIIQTTLVVSNLVFYTQSTSTVISG